jgi:hypothetical protein
MPALEQFGRKIIIPHSPNTLYVLERRKDGKGDIFGGRANLNEHTGELEPVRVTLGRELLAEGGMWLTDYDETPIYTSVFYPENEDKGSKITRDVFIGSAIGEIQLGDEHVNWAAVTVKDAIEGDYNLDDTTLEMFCARRELIVARLGHFARQ